MSSLANNTYAEAIDNHDASLSIMDFVNTSPYVDTAWDSYKYYVKIGVSSTETKFLFKITKQFEKRNDVSVDLININEVVSQLVSKLHDVVPLDENLILFGDFIENSIAMRFNKRNDVKLSLYFNDQPDSNGSFLEDAYLSYIQDGMRRIENGSLDDMIYSLINVLR